MEIRITNYFVCVMLSVVIAGIIIPNIMTIAFRRRLFDEQDERKIHKGVVPRLGGISFLPSLIFSLCVVVGINIRFQVGGIESMLVSPIVSVFFLLCALMLMYLVGMADDLVGVRYRAKFMFQVVAGVLIIMSGTWASDLYGFMWLQDIPTLAGWILTIFLLLAIINAINLIDGIDGLASGLSIIALIFYSYLFFLVGDYIYSFLAGATLGTLIPFFYYNVFGSAERHNKIFMGDTGSLTIGTILSFLSVKTLELGSDPMGSGENMFVLAFVPVMIPCLDVARVFLHRIKRGKNPFLPDKCHIHHKLLALGFRQWQALITILVVDVCFIMLNMVLSPYMNPTVLIAIDIALYALLNVLLTAMIRRRECKLHTCLYE